MTQCLPTSTLKYSSCLFYVSCFYVFFWILAIEKNKKGINGNKRNTEIQLEEIYGRECLAELHFTRLYVNNRIISVAYFCYLNYTSAKRDIFEILSSGVEIFLMEFFHLLSVEFKFDLYLKRIFFFILSIPAYYISQTNIKFIPTYSWLSRHKNA